MRAECHSAHVDTYASWDKDRGNCLLSDDN